MLFSKPGHHKTNTHINSDVTQTGLDLLGDASTQPRSASSSSWPPARQAGEGPPEGATAPSAASLEPAGMSKLCRDLKATWKCMSRKATDILPIEAEQRAKLKWGCYNVKK